MMNPEPDQNHVRPAEDFPVPGASWSGLVRWYSPLLTATAWLVILTLALGSLLLHAGAAANEPKQRDDAMTLVLLEVQSKFLVGLEQMQPGSAFAEWLKLKESLDQGSVAVRQRLAILAAIFEGDPAAAAMLTAIDDELHESDAAEVGEGAADEDEHAIQSVLLGIYASGATLAADDGSSAADAAAPTALSAADRELLERKLGWFGQLAIAHASPYPGAAPVFHAAQRLAVGLFVVLIAGGLLGLAGLAGLIVFIALAATGALRRGVAPGRVPPGIYAETFALWMLTFYLFQILADLLDEGNLLLVAVAMLASLSALAWPMVRGARWSDVRQDVGWTLGRQPALEPIIGVAGYAMTLPLLAAGVVMTLLLMAIQNALSGESEALGPGGGPAHPVIVELANADWWICLKILVLGAVAAPVVEETMFRGVLYRHLRDAFGRLGLAASIALSTLINTFLFAFIHPQGWVAIPALMSLAVGMTMMREWRGTLVPSMIVHGISNGLVLSLLMIMLAR